MLTMPQGRQRVCDTIGTHANQCLFITIITTIIEKNTVMLNHHQAVPPLAQQPSVQHLLPAAQP